MSEGPSVSHSSEASVGTASLSLPGEDVAVAFLRIETASSLYAPPSVVFDQPDSGDIASGAPMEKDMRRAGVCCGSLVRVWISLMLELKKNTTLWLV